MVKYIMKINNVPVSISNEQMKRLERVIKKSSAVNRDKNRNRKLREAGDILKG